MNPNNDFSYEPGDWFCYDWICMQLLKIKSQEIIHWLWQRHSELKQKLVVYNCFQANNKFKTASSYHLQRNSPLESYTYWPLSWPDLPVLSITVSCVCFITPSQHNRTVERGSEYLDLRAYIRSNHGSHITSDFWVGNITMPMLQEPKVSFTV
jgi:hypothetical protein